MRHCDIVQLTMDSTSVCAAQCEAASPEVQTVAAHMTHHLLSCVGLCPSTRPRSEPAHCVWDGKVGSRPQRRLVSAQPPIQYPSCSASLPTTAVRWDCDRCLLLCTHVSGSMIGPEQNGTKESQRHSMSTVFKG